MHVRSESFEWLRKRGSSTVTIARPWRSSPHKCGVCDNRLGHAGACEPFFSLFNLTERQVLSCISFGYSALAFYVDGGRILQMLRLLHRNKLRVTLLKTNGGFIDLNKASHLLCLSCQIVSKAIS